jgi:opacity protein-like surface antigen
MWKYLLACALVLTSFAYGNSFYVGGSVGVSALNAKKDHQILGAADVVLKSEKHDLGRFGFIGGGFIGYNFDFCQCYDLGAEFFGNGFTTHAKATHDVSSTVSIPSELKISQRYNWGFRVLPGVRFCNPVEAHAIVGYTRGGFKLHDNGVYGITSKNFSANGYQVGAGTSFALNSCFSIRLDVIYSGYPNKLNAIGIAPSVAEGGPTGGVITDYEIRTSAVDSTLSFVFGF